MKKVMKARCAKINFCEIIVRNVEGGGGGWFNPPPPPAVLGLNALDFNVCRSEGVISFFWRSV